MNNQANDRSGAPSARKPEDDKAPKVTTPAAADTPKTPSLQTPVWHDTDDQDIIEKE
jgi:hypothetical protein